MPPYQITDPMDCQISDEEQPWFHGKLDRHEAEALLQHTGDFLVRYKRWASGSISLLFIRHDSWYFQVKD